MDHLNIGAIIEKLGWRQGSILQDEDADEFLGSVYSQRSNNDVVIVVSHSCDLAHDDLETEPYTEIIVGTMVQKENGQFTAAKHPRRLHLRLSQQDGSEQTIELTPVRRYWVERKRLAEIEPDATRYLQKRQLQYLVRWLAGRYERAALPTAFNDRVKATEKKRQRIYKRLSSHISGLYIKIDPFKELQPHEQYQAQLLALVPVDFQADLQSVSEQVQRLAAFLSEENISIAWKVRREDEVAISIFRQFERFPLEHLSLREEPPHSLPADL